MRDVNSSDQHKRLGVMHGGSKDLLFSDVCFFFLLKFCLNIEALSLHSDRRNTGKNILGKQCL